MIVNQNILNDLYISAGEGRKEKAQEYIIQKIVFDNNFNIVSKHKYFILTFLLFRQMYML